MRKEDCFYVGKISKKFSFKGEVILYIDADDPQEYTEMESFFIAFGNDLVPFFIQKSRLQKGSNLRLKLEDIDSEEDADGIVGLEVFLPLDLLPTLAEDKFYYHEIIGFDVLDQNLGNVGKIVSVNDTTSQVLLEILNNSGKEILIPLVDDFIISVKKEEKVFQVNTPEGLIDLYLNED
jgi:16S rRNA processing protein RimM